MKERLIHWGHKASLVAVGAAAAIALGLLALAYTANAKSSQTEPIVKEGFPAVGVFNVIEFEDGTCVTWMKSEKDKRVRLLSCFGFGDGFVPPGQDK